MAEQGTKADVSEGPDQGKRPTRSCHEKRSLFMFCLAVLAWVAICLYARLDPDLVARISLTDDSNDGDTDICMIRLGTDVCVPHVPQLLGIKSNDTDVCRIPKNENSAKEIEEIFNLILNGTCDASVIAGLIDYSDYSAVFFAVLIDLQITQFVIIGALGVTIVTSIVDILLFYWIGSIISWLSIIIFPLPFIAGGVCCLLKATESNVQPFLPASVTRDYISAVYQWAILAALLIFISTAYTATIIIIKNKISRSIILIIESSKIIRKKICSQFAAAVIWIFHIFGLTLMLATFLTLGEHIYGRISQDYYDSCNCSETYGNFSIGDYCDIHKFRKLCYNCSSVCMEVPEGQSLIKTMGLYNILMYAWYTGFLFNLAHMIHSTNFASVYFSKDPHSHNALLNPTWTTLRYHLGTVAIGSLFATFLMILGLCVNKFVAFGIKMALKMLKIRRKNKFTYMWLWLNHKIPLLCKHAYVLCLIEDQKFFESTKRVMKLWKYDLLQLSEIAGFVVWLKVAQISGLITVISYLVILKLNLYQSFHGVVPLLVTWLGSTLIAAAVFSFFPIAIDTLIICYLEDQDKNDGSRERPYKMPKKLVKLLSKKRKKKGDDLGDQEQPQRSVANPTCE